MLSADIYEGTYLFLPTDVKLIKVYSIGSIDRVTSGQLIKGELVVRKLISLVSLGLAAIFGFFFYVQYFKWRTCFNELGRCYDRETGTVYLEQSGQVWISLTVLALGISLYQALRMRR